MFHELVSKQLQNHIIYNDGCLFYFQVSLFAGDDSSPGGDVGEGRGVSIVSYRDLYQGTFLRDVIKQM